MGDPFDRHTLAMQFACRFLCCSCELSGVFVGGGILAVNETLGIMLRALGNAVYAPIYQRLNGKGGQTFQHLTSHSCDQTEALPEAVLRVAPLTETSLNPAVVSFPAIMPFLAQRSIHPSVMVAR